MMALKLGSTARWPFIVVRSAVRSKYWFDRYKIQFVNRAKYDSIRNWVYNNIFSFTNLHQKVANERIVYCMNICAIGIGINHVIIWEKNIALNIWKKLNKKNKQRTYGKQPIKCFSRSFTAVALEKILFNKEIIGYFVWVWLADEQCSQVQLHDIMQFFAFHQFSLTLLSLFLSLYFLVFLYFSLSLSLPLYFTKSAPKKCGSFRCSPLFHQFSSMIYSIFTPNPANIHVQD